LDLVIHDVPQSEKLFIRGDFNGHIDAKADRYDMTHGALGYQERNNGELFIMDFAVAYELLVVNSYFKNSENHLVTVKSGITNTQTDYFFIRTNNMRLRKDYKVIPSKYLGTQHRLLVIHVEFKCSK